MDMNCQQICKTSRRRT